MSVRGNGEDRSTISVIDDLVYRIDPDFLGVTDPNPVPEEGAYLGQPFRELLERMGQPESARGSVGGSTSMPELQLSFREDLGVNISRGIVVGFR